MQHSWAVLLNREDRNESAGRSRQLEFVGQSTREEGVAQKESSRNLQKGLFESMAEITAQ